MQLRFIHNAWKINNYEIELSTAIFVFECTQMSWFRYQVDERWQNKSEKYLWFV